MNKTRIVLFSIVLSGAVLSLLQTPAAFAAGLAPVTMKSDDTLPNSRWVFTSPADPKALLKIKGFAKPMSEAKAAQMAGQGAKCVEKIKAARLTAKTPQQKSLLPWFSIMELDCARSTEIGKGGAALLAAALDIPARNPVWMNSGPHLSLLRTSLLKSSLALLEQDIKSNRTRAWVTIERMQDMSSFIDDKSRGRLWRLAGELAFMEQKPEAARDFYKRSLLDVDSDDTRTKLSQVENSLQAGRPAKGGTPSANAAVPSGTVEKNVSLVDASKEEIELSERISSELKRGELVNAVDDAIKLIKAYPGSSRAKWATDRVLEAYNTVMDKQDTKSQLIRDEIAGRMEAADGDRVAEWARVLYNRGQYDDSYRLGQRALKSIDGTRRTKVLELNAEAAIATDHFDKASDNLMELIEKHSGTPSSREALLRLGILKYRQGNYSQSAVVLERLLALPQTDNLEVTSRYWMWRVLQKNKSERADASADELMRKFPFSYYGLRARFERNGGILEWKPETGKVESKIWMTGRDRAVWDRVQTLLQAGWLDEAQAEIKDLPPPMRSEDKALRALVWAAAAGFTNAAKLANEAWDEKPEMRRPPFVNAAFPAEFDSVIETQAGVRGLNRYLVKGLIKQESGYNVKAVSSSNALGLMQMIPPTAKEIASELKLGSLSLPDDMFQPARNIQMGTYYIGRMVNKYQGNVPLALAAYNAGPARMDRWLRSRPSLKSLATLRSSKPEDEIWFDEIPYNETSFYVKAILRNILLYRMFEKGRVEVPDPVWVM
jgi:soluble lytic murein transglycosylase